MTARQAGTVDQIVFRWDGANPLGNTGFGPVAWSGERSQVARLFKPISHLLRSAGRDTSPALVRLVSDDSPTAMLVHRRPGRGVGGRQDTLCHALYGPEDSLDPETCLGLHAWDWEGSAIPLGEVRGPLEPVPLAALGESALEGGQRLAGRLREAKPVLTAVAAEVLRNPGALYTVLDRMSGDGPCRLLWALHGIFSRVLPRAWTFATHDTAESRQLGFMFVSRWSSSPDQDGPRVRTDPWEPPDDRPREVAEQLVLGYLGAVERGDAHEFELADALLAALPGPGAVRDSRALVFAAEDALASLERRTARERRAHPVSPSEREWPEREWPHLGRSAAEPSQSDVSTRPASSSSFDPPTVPEARAEEAASATTPSTTAAPAVTEALPVVRSAWPEPSGQPRRLSVLGRRPTPQATDLLLAELRDSRNERDRVAAIRNAGNDGLLVVLASNPSYDVLTLVVHRIAERWQDWTAAERKKLCESVLRRELFLARHNPPFGGGPDEAVRAANAAALYRWAVRPFAAEPDIGKELGRLLPRLFHGTDPTGRGAAEQILTGADDPGITFQVWQKLLRGATAPSGPPPGLPGQPEPALPLPPSHDPRPHDHEGQEPRDHGLRGRETQRREPPHRDSEGRDPQRRQPGPGGPEGRDPRHREPRSPEPRSPEPRPHNPWPPGSGSGSGSASDHGKHVRRDPDPRRVTATQSQTRTHYPPDDQGRSRRDQRRSSRTWGHASGRAAGDGRAFVLALGGFGILVVILLVVVIAVS
ncbi:hypothetical protein [Streptomyces xantholiticus]|uniref:hypothetical protein n=1 Tax=Streptomyces xantholiticus TaxID=68285 RepID=UPI0016764650|nr:hypothetical protein [Streptomyces xantholiticus]GGW56379.1 hypothetical protein GCM10010381_47160 [Streptomyces xantholiticus]